ncbi:MAG: cysteine peptidase family C39 domain-containing protein [Candidatus Pacearchaeota archaeon]
MKQIKIFKQETDKSCGVACLRSILNYYGNDFSEKDIFDIKKNFNSEKWGLQNPQINLGNAALRLGFNVTYIGENHIIAYNNQFKDIKKSLKEKLKTYSDYGKFVAEETLEFLKRGGKIKIELLTIEKIKKILNKYKFAIVEINPASIRKKGNNNLRHKIILTGYTKNGFEILNPSDTKKYVYPFDDFIFAFYQAEAELLIIQNKK